MNHVVVEIAIEEGTRSKPVKMAMLFSTSPYHQATCQMVGAVVVN